MFWGHIDDLVVGPADRGQGVGTVLLTEAMTLAKHHGCTGLTLTSRDDPARQAARRLYREMGFKIVGTDLFGLVLPSG